MVQKVSADHEIRAVESFVKGAMRETNGEICFEVLSHRCREQKQQLEPGHCITLLLFQGILTTMPHVYWDRRCHLHDE